jgi:large subunit ribosomal protein L23
MSGFHFANILVEPVISEKSNDMMIEENKYIFSVSAKATKTDIKRAVAERFNVKVKQVNIINLPRKPKRVGMRRFMSDKRRKAIVTLVEGQGIPELSQAV